MIVTVGFFDGVHLGHKRVLRCLGECKENAVVTFWPHPRVVLQHDARDFCLLSSMEEKCAMIRSFGIQNIRCLDFTPEFARVTAEEFIRDVLVKDMGCDHLVLGYDNKFGSDALETAQVAALCEKMGLKVDVVKPYVYEDSNVSSTRIRNALLDGDVHIASQMLGYRYQLQGVVVSGNQLGRTIGFPTANLRPSFPLKTIPKNGVYATDVIVSGKRYRGMTNVGIRPTLGSCGERIIETNIFDFDSDIYGMEIKVNFIERIRNEQRFPSLEELKVQLATDKHRCYGCN